MKLKDLIEKAAAKKVKAVAVAHAADKEVIQAVKMAAEHLSARFLLTGDSEKLKELLANEPKFNAEIIHADSPEESAAKAVRAVREKEADVLMKGNLPSSTLLKSVLNRQEGLRSKRVLSHVAVFEVPDYDRLIYVTDSALNIAPSLEELRHILQNAVHVAHSVGNHMPKAAVLAAIETVNPKMEATLNAAAIVQMCNRGQITGCVADGPLALDNAVSAAAAAQKNISGSVAGQADILLVPSIEAGNMLYKSMIYFAKANVAGVITGAKAPIALTSRADTAENKLYSIALAICASQEQ
ncbi:phosphate butyryltransferase [Bacillus nakamurai]|uniref:Phosphate butyryltransferase n=1 Tax=Bacillus nakamurai TaxID=1793963 RepID=A0A150F9Z3_9BACI|nr:phosphate butyryltransferase [Bacillus nakamurai]KXZ21458.1 phosphate butyryltransferase [Bacillus nakamurai]KXZ23007.1 phosphate butyryltransferase [Bacillus nakamurai]MCC9021165.1 phosphate butyryltransferase [Bacillus nakamurai]MED1229389.1 phosphate butyryltransferase [Bacillus nakamurai]